MIDVSDDGDVTNFSSHFFVPSAMALSGFRYYTTNRGFFAKLNISNRFRRGIYA